MSKPIGESYHPNRGLCDACKWQKMIRNTRGSTFSMCRHPALPKYPRLPVLSCSGFEQRATSNDEPERR